MSPAKLGKPSPREGERVAGLTFNGMIRELFLQAWDSLKRQPLRSFLTMLGIVWGIVTVTLLIAYGNSFRSVLVTAFNAFGKGAVIVWPATTSEQAGGERAGKPVLLEKEDVELIHAEATLVKSACLETVRWQPIAYGERMA
ncbi:MAG TPA: ABC transporter permease, partial [Terriglobia bacterium]|nr:ABC transporter permease [Terriglobia bacterium]